MHCFLCIIAKLSPPVTEEHKLPTNIHTNKGMYIATFAQIITCLKFKGKICTICLTTEVIVKNSLQLHIAIKLFEWQIRFGETLCGKQE